MTRWWNAEGRRRTTALLAAAALAAPLLTAPAAAAQIFGGRQQAPAAQKQGMSTKKKVVLLAGAALLYYLYKKHQAKRADAQRQQAGYGQTTPGGTRVAQRMPQLYRSKNGGIYYRDPNGRAVWLTAPTRSLQVPVEEVQRYAPDYTRYRGPAPSIPSGARRERFEDFNGSLLTGASYPGARSSSGGGTASGPPGPRR